jgi:hypothetical protein
MFYLARQLTCENYLCEKAVDNGWGATTAMTGNEYLQQLHESYTHPLWRMVELVADAVSPQSHIVG